MNSGCNALGSGDRPMRRSGGRFRATGFSRAERRAGRWCQPLLPDRHGRRRAVRLNLCRHGLRLLHRQSRFGAEWRTRWREETLARFPAWASIRSAIGASPRAVRCTEMSYTVPLWPEGEFAKVSSGNYWWGRCPMSSTRISPPRWSHSGSPTPIFRTVAGALRRHDPDHLYLGSRFAWQTREAVEACEHWCDVVSFNRYRRSVGDDPNEWARFHAFGKHASRNFRSDLYLATQFDDTVGRDAEELGGIEHIVRHQDEESVTPPPEFPSARART